MEYLNETFKRASIKSLREYLLNGVNEEEHSPESYEVRLNKAYEQWMEIVNQYDNRGKESKLYSVINNVIAEHQHVYMEVGIQAGFNLARDIEKNGEEDQLSIKYKAMYSSLFQDVTKAVEDLQNAQSKAEEIYMSAE